MDESKGGGAGGLLRGLKVAAGTLAALVALLEVVPRIVPVPGLRLADLAPDLEKTLAEAQFVGHPYLGYAPRPGWRAPDGHLTINEWGFRSNGGPPVAREKPEGVYRIVCLGGSSTYGHTPSSDATTWPARLEHWLNDPDIGGGAKRVEVLNFGASGYSTFESTVNLAFRAIEFAPDLVVVYHTINDMRCALWLRGGPITMDNRHWRTTWPRVVEQPGERLLEHSRTYLLLRRLLTDYVQGMDQLNTYPIVGYDPDDKDPYERGVPDEQGFRNFRRNLVSIAGIAGAHGAQVVLVTQGCDTSKLFAGSRDNQIAGMARMTGILKEVAAERDLILVDAKTEMEAKAAAEEPGAIFTKEVHLTDKGAEALALILAREIGLERHLVK